MCCQETRTLDLPAEVIEALAHYRRLLDERGWDWGDEQLPGFFRWARFSSSKRSRRPATGRKRSVR